MVMVPSDDNLMSNNERPNRGLILEPQDPKLWMFGGLSGIAAEDHTVLREDGQWLDFLPKFEPQSDMYMDCMGCVSFSALNTLETIARYRNIDLNCSDRFTAKMSGTTSNGNSFSKVWSSIAENDGTVPEDLWPFSSSIKTWSEFYATIPNEIITVGKERLDNIKVRYESVTTDKESLMDALRFGPLQVAIYAYPSIDSNGVYVATTKIANHGVMLVGYVYGKYWLIFDSYENDSNSHDGQIKKLAWNTKISAALLPTIIQINGVDNYNYMKLQEKIIYQLVEAPGGFFTRIGDVVYKLTTAEEFEAARLRFETATISTNKGTQVIQLPKYGTVTKEDMEGVTYRNMKGEILGTF